MSDKPKTWPRLHWRGFFDDGTLRSTTAEVEKALIREQTKAGLRYAKAEGRVDGNPRLKAGDPVAIRKARAARVECHFHKLNASAEHCVPEVRRLRPDMAWEDVLSIVNSGLPRDAKPWTQSRLIRAANNFVREGLLPAAILGRALQTEKNTRLRELPPKIGQRRKLRSGVC